MPKFFCDYCDVYLTHDSMSVRKAHNSGRNHLRNVVDYYQQIGHEKAQSVIDSITNSYAAEGQSANNPMLNSAPPGFGPPGGMAPPAGLPPGFPMPPGGMPPGFPAGMPPLPQGLPPGFNPPPGMPPAPPGMPPGLPPLPQGLPPGFPPGGPPSGSPPAGMPFPPPGMAPPGMNGPPGMPPYQGRRNHKHKHVRRLRRAGREYCRSRGYSFH